MITSRKRLIESGYLKEDGSERGTKAFIVENPRPVDIRQHVLLMAEFYREKQAERQAARRAHVQAVSPENGETGKAMSQHPMENCDVSPNPGGKYPSDSPEEAMKEGILSGSDPSPVEEGDFYPIPESETEADRMLARLVGGVPVPGGIVAHFRKKLMRGELCREMVDVQLEFYA